MQRLTIIFIVTMCFLFAHMSNAYSDDQQIGNVYSTPQLVLTGGVRLAGKEQPTIRDSFVEINGEVGYYPVLINKGYYGVNLGYSTVSIKSVNQNKVGVGLSYREIVSPSLIGITLWLYTNEILSGNQKQYFNSVAAEFEASFGLGVGFGIEFTKFDYGQMKQGDGLLATIYGKLGISVIPTDWLKK